jgi:hypothetical protein
VTVAVVAALLVGCAHRERAADPITAPAPPPSTTSSVLVPPPVTAHPPTGSHPHSSAPHLLADGRHAGYVTAIDGSARTITVDVIQFLTGDAANEAFHQDHPEVGGNVPNGYYIRNVNTRLRTLPVRQNATVHVVWRDGDAGTEPITFDELPGYFADDLNPDDGRLWYDPFWLTVHDDRVESIVEQYIP